MSIVSELSSLAHFLGFDCALSPRCLLRLDSVPDYIPTSHQFTSKERR